MYYALPYLKTFLSTSCIVCVVHSFLPPVSLAHTHTHAYYGNMLISKRAWTVYFATSLHIIRHFLQKKASFAECTVHARQL